MTSHLLLISVRSPMLASYKPQNDSFFNDDGSTLAQKESCLNTRLKEMATPRRQIFVRPKSEIITVLDWQQVSNERPEQWQNETCLDAQFFESKNQKIKTGYVCGSYELTCERLRAESDNEAVENIPEVEHSRHNSTDVKRSALTINLRPKSVRVKPQLVKAQSMASLPRNVVDSDDSQSAVKDRSGLNRRKGSLDVSLAKLRHEMNSLRRQDMQLLEQLLNLNNSIQDFKLSQHALPYDSSDESDNADDTVMEKPLKPKRRLSRGDLGSNQSDQVGEIMERPLEPKRWHSRGSLGSDESDHAEIAMEAPLKPKRWLSRGSLGSDGSDYHSASSRLSIGSGSVPSLSGSDVASYDSGQESGTGLKSCRRRSKGKFGSMDLRRVSFGAVRQRSGSEVFFNENEVVFPAKQVRRNSDFRLAEIKSIRTLSKRQSTIW